MAIWQYHINVVPEEEIKSYFKSQDFIRGEDIENIDWWKYRDLEIKQFIDLEKLFPPQKSWSDEIIIYGKEDSNCIELLLSKNKKIEEISIRIDLREENQNIIELICNFFEKHHCLFLGFKGKIINPNIDQLISEIKNYNVYSDFLEKLSN